MEKQQVRSVDVISTLAVLILLMVSFLPFLSVFESREKIKLTKRAESLAYQVLGLNHVKSSSRSPSSDGSSPVIGEIGTDKFGQPYKFKINKEHSFTEVLIWSEASKVSTLVRIPNVDH